MIGRESLASELAWIVGPERAAVRRRTSRIFSLWPRPGGAGQAGEVPMGLHLALARPDEELYSDPTATRALVSWALPCPRIPAPVAWMVVVLAAAVFATGRHLGSGEWLPMPERTLSSGADLALVFFGAALGYTLAAAWEAGVCAGRLELADSCFGLGQKGPSVEHVVWRLGLPLDTALLAILGPLLGSAAILTWAHDWPSLGSGLTMGSGLYLLRVCLPTRPGPLTRVLEFVLRVPDFSSALRFGLTSFFLPAAQRPSSPRTGIVLVGAVALLAWIMVAGTLIPALVSPDGIAALVGALPAGDPERARFETPSGQAARAGSEPAPTIAEESAPAVALHDAVWRVVMSLVGIAVLLWLVESIVRLFRYALLFGGRIEREPVSPSSAARSFWARESALTRHVPAMAKLPWQWTRASAGNLLVRQGDHDRSFHWLASGEARVVARDARGNLRQLAILRGGSGVGEMALLENQPRMADVVVSRTALVVSLSFEDFERGLPARDRDLFREVVLAGRAFATSSVFRGCPAPDKERWIRSGTPRRHRAGDMIIAEGSTDRWMGLVVEGRIDVRQGASSVAELASGSVFGEVAFLYETARNASLVAKDDALLWRWEAEWLTEEVVRTGVRADLEALAAARARAG